MTACPDATVSGTIKFNDKDVRAKFASLRWNDMETAFAQHPPITSIYISDLDGEPEAVNQLLVFVTHKVQQHPQQLNKIFFADW